MSLTNVWIAKGKDLLKIKKRLEKYNKWKKKTIIKAKQNETIVYLKEGRIYKIEGKLDNLDLILAFNKAIDKYNELNQEKSMELLNDIVQDNELKSLIAKQL
jgi:galactitol-specific phosphotransferase system IIB component